MKTQTGMVNGLSFIELFLVLAAAIVLIASVDTWLEDYRARSHVAEALRVAEIAKSEIEILCAENDSPDVISNEVIAREFPYSPYVASITISGSCFEPQIALQTINTGLFVEPMLVITGDLSGEVASWSCASSGMQEDVPERCRGI